MERKKLCILGTAETMKQAPFEDDSFEIWGMSSLIGDPECKRLDRAFEFHPKRYWGQLPVMTRFNKHDVPIYMQDHYDEIPTSVKYPYEEIRERFYLPTMGDTIFVTNSITWIILLAIQEGYTDYLFLGVHMAHDKEYSYQQPSCSWALGIIHGFILQGLPYSIELPKESELLKARYEYGYQEPSKLMLEIEERKNRLKLGVDQVNSQMAGLQQSKWKTEGALEECAYWRDHVYGWR